MRLIEENLDAERKNLVKAQPRFKRDFDCRMKQKKNDRKIYEFVYMYPESGGGKKPGNHEIGPQAVLARYERKFMIKSGEVVEQVKIDRVNKAPAPQKGRGTPET